MSDMQRIVCDTSSENNDQMLQMLLEEKMLEEKIRISMLNLK